MQSVSQSEHPWRQAATTEINGRVPQVLLIGFDERAVEIMSGYLAALSIEARAHVEPFDAMAVLIDEPGNWLTCVLNAAAFATDIDLRRYMQLFAFEGQATSMILSTTHGNARLDMISDEDAPLTVGDILNRHAFETAIGRVMARRGRQIPAADSAAAPRPVARSGRVPARTIPVFAPATRIKAAPRIRRLPHGRQAASVQITA